MNCSILFCAAYLSSFVLAQIPADSPASQHKTYAALLDGGKAKVLESIAKLPDNEGAYALEGMARVCTEPGAKPAWRVAFETAVLEVIATNPSPYLVKMIHWAGTDASVPALAGLLADKDLADPALRSLQTIGTDAAAAAVRESLPRSEGRIKTGHLLVLAALRDTRATDLILAELSNDTHRVTALQALAAIGDPKAEKALLDAPNLDDRFTSQALLLRYAERLAANGHTEQASALCRTLVAKYTGPEFGHVQARALSTLAEVANAKALPDLLATFSGPSMYVQARAAELIAGLDAPSASAAAGKTFADASLSGKVLLLDALALRGDADAQDTIMTAIGDSDEAVRNAAMASATRMGGDAASKALGKAVLDGNVDAWTQLGRVATPADIAAMYPKASTPAIQAALLNALESAGAQGHMATVLAALKDKDASVQKVAASIGKSAALPADLPALLKIYQTSEASQKRRVLGLMQAGARRENDVDKRLSLLSGLYKESKEAGLIPLLAASESPKVVATLSDISSSADKAASTAAIKQLVKSQDPAAKDALIKVASSLKDDRNAIAMNRLLQLTGVESAAALLPLATLPDHLSTLKARDSVATLKATKGWRDVNKVADHWTGEITDLKEDDQGIHFGKKQGNLVSKEVYADFLFSFEFALTEGCNNGIGIRVPEGGGPSKDGMELQILDNTAERYNKLKPEQFHGSLYMLAAAKKGFLKPVGEWNQQLILVIGQHVKVVLNDEVILDVYLDKLDPALIKDHKGVASRIGHIVFCAHGEEIKFRKLKIKDYSIKDPNFEPNKQSGFKELFNGKDLTNWKGLVGNPKTRATMSADALAKAQVAADEKAARHWKAEDGVLVFDGRGDNLCTSDDYEDFDLIVDWKIEAKGDSGIYLRGCPQVSIWDTENVDQFQHGCDKGSGALWNNRTAEKFPKEKADKLAGHWNRFLIRMVNDRVDIWLNGKHVTDNVILENYWERDKPVYRSGPIELQNHGNRLYFDNIWVRILPN